jgi:hypothetical protein
MKGANGTPIPFNGQLGLAPEWATGSCNTQCQEYVSACVMAHVNTAGLHIPLWMTAAQPNVGWGQSADFPLQESSFFGNIFVSPPRAYYCDGDGFSTTQGSVTAGRIHASETGTPLYRNPFGDKVLCKNTYGAAAHVADGSSSADGYTQLNFERPWTNVVTVWRKRTYVANFDPANKYTFYALNTRADAQVIDVSGGTPYPGARVQQWPRNYSTSQFYVLASGANWTIVPGNDKTKCLDAGAGYEGAGVTVQNCNGSASQQWAVNTNGGYGSAYFHNIGSGRCLNTTGTTQGATISVSSCQRVSWQEFRILAVVGP